MKRKLNKFKPLQELYNHSGSTFNPKVESEFAKKLKENCSGGSYHKVKCRTSNACAVPVPCSSYEHFSSVTSEMVKQGTSLSEVSLEKATVNQTSGDQISLNRSANSYRKLEKGKTSSVLCTLNRQSSYDEDVLGLGCFGTSETTGNSKVLQNVNTSQTAEERQDLDVIDCQGNDTSCISKDNGEVMASSDNIGCADHKMITSKAASTSSLCPEDMDLEAMGNSVNDHSTSIGSLGDQFSVEESSKCAMAVGNYSSEAALDSSNRSDPAETLVIDEHNEGHPLKGVPSDCSKEQVKVTDSNILVHVEKSHVAVKHETGSSDRNPSASGSFNSTDGNDFMKLKTSVSNMLRPPSQSHIITHGDGSDELVDVRVCDICGDIGREALLALCSRCGDGAEHIYCMRVKMDEVPEGDWVCEECMVMPEPKKQRQAIVGNLANASKRSCLGELGQSLSTENLGLLRSAETRLKHLNKVTCSSVKRPGTDVEVRSAAKKRTLEKSVQLLKSSGFGAQLSRISSLKNIDKREDAAHQIAHRPATKLVEQACSSGHRSPKHEKYSSRGSLCKSKSMGSSYSNREVSQLREDSRQKRSSTREIARSKLGKYPPDKKLFKSLSFTGVSSVPLNVSNNHSSYASKVKILGNASGRKRESCDSPKSKTSQLGDSSTRSGSMKVRPSGTKVVQEIVKPVLASRKIIQDKKAIRADGHSNVKSPGSLAQKGKNCSNTSATCVGEKLSPGHPSHAILSYAKSITAYPDKKTSLSAPKAELESTAGDDNHQLVDTAKAISYDLCPVKSMPMLAPADRFPSEVSAVPEAECTWKGAFKLEKSGKLPNYCYGVQAHLSTCASSKVNELVSKFCPKLMFQEVPRVDTWPIQSQSNQPSDQDISLYFFAEDAQSYNKNYKKLLEGMIKYDLALEAKFDGVQLLVFPSSLLPVQSQRWNSLSFLWGVCRARKVADGSLHLRRLDVATMNQELCAPITRASKNKIDCPLEAESSFGFQKVDNCLRGQDFVDPAVFQSSALTKSKDQSCEHEVTSIKSLVSQEKLNIQAHTIQVAHDPAEEEAFSGSLLHNDVFQGGTGYSLQDMKCISRTDTFGESNRVDLVSSAVNFEGIGLYSDRSYRRPSFPSVYDSTSELCQKPDIASRSSFSIDSGPSGSSDGCVKSDDVQVEQLENPARFGNLNLDLSLGFSSAPEEHVDLDLVLGFPSKYDPKHHNKTGSNIDGSVSLTLSLGLPCSNA